MVYDLGCRVVGSGLSNIDLRLIELIPSSLALKIENAGFVVIFHL